MTDDRPKQLDPAALDDACSRFVKHLYDEVVVDARGDRADVSEVEPQGRFWLGLLATEQEVQESDLGQRMEKMRPCAIGMRIRPTGAGPWGGRVGVRAAAWFQDTEQQWRKTDVFTEEVAFEVESTSAFPVVLSLEVLARQLANGAGSRGHRVEVRIEMESGRDGSPELVVQVVNATPRRVTGLADTNLYQVEMRVEGVETNPFLQEGLPDSFRYDRRVAAYGLNCGVDVVEGGLVSTDTVDVDRHRPVFWSVDEEQPDLRFDALAGDPLPQLKELVAAHERWGRSVWSQEELERRAADEKWTDAMLAEARTEAERFSNEAERMSKGIRLLESDAAVLQAYRLMNRAIGLASRGRYDSWRPFQVGFQLACLAAVSADKEEADVVDVLWFTTGGGKTETYLGLLVMAALYDRIRGKTHGITAWSRFPLRLLSLQQTQRFADALAGAEIVRRQEGLGGDPFRVGFFVGGGNTPNEIREEPENDADPDPLDDEMPGRFRVLMHCPFCRSELEMGFDHERWTLEHRCTGDALDEGESCPWPEAGLPFHVVDTEIYRFLPTLVVGTLDKAAALGFQAAMRGFVGAPLGFCSMAGHGHTYTTNRRFPTGCRVPGCAGSPIALPQSEQHYRLTFRLQDELHLLRDSLGAVDSHYESLLDGISGELTAGKSKILASSATLAGFEHQCGALYSRESRVFPLQGPTAASSFWSAESEKQLRRYVALAPRGVTNEFAHDRILTKLQGIVRSALSDPGSLARDLDVDEELVAQLVSLYGTQIVYGNTKRDVEASLRSLETQVQVDGELRTQEMTGGTDFDDVRGALRRLEVPEEDFQDRIHVVCASSMISHGVDVDRLNCMVLMGQPLTTAEFIQATARVGRRWPGLVFVLHRMARERDVGLFRSFPAFIRQGDRFVEAIPITRRSRRVLERTVSGIAWARMLAVTGPRVDGVNTCKKVADAINSGEIDPEAEIRSVCDTLGIDQSDSGMVKTVRENMDTFFREVRKSMHAKSYPSKLWASEPMMSLRDVEETRPVTDES